jgi:transcriptional regulator with XRE-family HTH domain
MDKSINGTEVRALFSRNLKRLRAARNLSQLALSSLTGLTHNFINDIENGKKWVSPETIAKLSAALQAEPYHFFLPVAKMSREDRDLVSGYLDEVTDSIQKMAGDLKNRYLRDNEEGGT